MLAWRIWKTAAAIAERLAYEEKVGKEVARRDCLTGDEMRRILDDESPVKVWREKRGLSQRELAEQAGVSSSYLAEIETGKKPGSAEALRKLSRRAGDSDGELGVAAAGGGEAAAVT